MDTVLNGIAAKIFGTGGNDDDNEGGIPGMLVSVFNLDGNHATSLTTVAKKTLVGSNVYVENDLVQEDILVPLMGVVSQIYVGYVLTALEIYQSVDRYTTISESVGRVTTEAMKIPTLCDPVSELAAEFGTSVGTEALRDSKFSNEIDDNVKHLASGRLIEFEFCVDEHEKPVIVPINVQLYPVSMPSDVAEALVQFNYPERFWRRAAKAATREIHFFKDFILSMDLVERHRKVIQHDEHNILNEFYKDKITKQTRRVYDIITGRNRNNIANGVVVITSDTFTKINDEASIDLNNYSDRQRFFNEAYCMLMIVVDTNYQVIDMYYNGIHKKSEMPFRAIKQAGSSKSGIDITELMNTIAKGAAPKF